MKKINLALAGNPNVGKSVFFNQLTGGSQHVGNWPGKTVEKAEGTLNFLGREIKVVDLPGTSSLSAFSMEEKIAREFILNPKTDIILNVTDAASLERNLYLTLQLLEMNANVVLALNMVDVSREKGITIDGKKLSEILGVPVIPTIAVHSKGIQKSMIAVINNARKKPNYSIEYSPKIEQSIGIVSSKIKDSEYSNRWLAIKLLENDPEILEKFKSNKNLLTLVKKEQKKLEKLYGQDSPTILSSERYRKISTILSECRHTVEKEPSTTEKLDNILLHNLFGYLFLGLILFGLFYSIFSFGDFLSTILNDFLENLTILASTNDPTLSFFWDSILEGLIAGITIAIPYLLPFYILLAILEDTGYLPRIAFLMDGLMHKIGLHGKAFIPIALGYGCSVPACLGCRIMESEKQQFITSFLVTLVPCAARSVIIFGVVGAFLGVEWALILFAFNLLVVLFLGFLASKVIPGSSPALILEMPTYKMPAFGAILTRAWFRIRNFVRIAFPIIIVATLLIKSLEFFGILDSITLILTPITVDWLGLPAIVGITLIFGILRKELAVILLAALLGTENFGLILTPIQLIVFTVVSIFYIPCAATIATLYKEFGAKKTLGITLFDILFAITLGGIIRIVLINSGIF